MRQRTLNRIEAAARLIQAVLVRGCKGRSIARELRRQRDAKREIARSTWAVALLQTRWKHVFNAEVAFDDTIWAVSIT